MKIEAIAIKNMFGARDVNVKLETPVALFCGPNGAGKSSIQNAIRMALTGSPSRVSLKKDYKQIITKGAKKASCAVMLGDDEMCVASIPGKENHHHDSEYLPFVLEPNTFAAMKPADRRTFIFNLAGVSAKKEHIFKEMTSDGQHYVKQAEYLLPFLRQGFPAACEAAKDKARDAKADWKAITGEQWGEEKGEHFEIEVPQYVEMSVIEDLSFDIQEMRKKLNELCQTKGQHQAIQQRTEKDAELEEQFKADAALLERRQIHYDNTLKSYNTQQDYLVNLRQQAGQVPVSTLACPCCQVALIMSSGGTLEEYKRPKHNPAEANRKLDEHLKAVEMLKRSVDNSKAELEKSLAAKSYLDTKEELIEPETGINIESIDKKISELSAKIETDSSELKKLEAQHSEADKATERQTKADELHLAIKGWLFLADQLGPNGIPFDLVRNALNPFNERLNQNSEDTGWHRVAIDAEMNITYGGRAYHLLSESEQWRADAMIAETISAKSGLGLLFLDRFDVLELSARSQLFGWLDTLTFEKEIDTALVFGTLKKLPLNSDSMTAYWLEDGVAKDHREAA